MPNNLKITEIRVRLNPRDMEGIAPIAAWASCVVNDAIYLNNIAIRRCGAGRLTLVYPVAEKAAGRHTYFKPICREAADFIQDAVLEAYSTEVSRS